MTVLNYAAMPHLTRAANKRAYERLHTEYPEYAEALMLDIAGGARQEDAARRISELFDSAGWQRWLTMAAAHLAGQGAV